MENFLRYHLRPNYLRIWMIYIAARQAAIGLAVSPDGCQKNRWSGMMDEMYRMG